MYKTTSDLWPTDMHSAEYIEMSLVTRTQNCRHVAQFTVDSMLDRLNVEDGGRIVVEEGRKGDKVTEVSMKIKESTEIKLPECDVIDYQRDTVRSSDYKKTE